MSVFIPINKVQVSKKRNSPLSCFSFVCIGLILSSCAPYMPPSGSMGVPNLWPWYFGGHRLKTLWTPAQGQRVHIGEICNCLEWHFGKGGEMWAHNSVGQYAKIFIQSTVSPSADNCWCVHAGVCQHVQWVVTTVSTLRFTECLILYSCAFLFFLTRQAPHPRAPQHTGMKWIFA